MYRNSLRKISYNLQSYVCSSFYINLWNKKIGHQQQSGCLNCNFVNEMTWPMKNFVILLYNDQISFRTSTIQEPATFAVPDINLKQCNQTWKQSIKIPQYSTNAIKSNR